MADGRRRDLYLDAIRVLAILGVLYNHRETYLLAQSSLASCWVQIAAQLCRCAVPLFFMCSGVVMLGKEEPLPVLFKRRILRILVVMVACAAVVAHPDYSMANVVDALFHRLNWYLYAYLDYLLMLPLLRLLAKNLTSRAAAYYLTAVGVMYTACGIQIGCSSYIAMLDFAPIFNTQFASCCWAVIFPLAGFSLVRFGIGGMFGGVLVLLGAILSVFLNTAFIRHGTGGGVEFDALRVRFVFFPAIAVFWGIRRLFTAQALDRMVMLRRCVISAAGACFGIFLIETHTSLIGWVNYNFLWVKNMFGSFPFGCVTIVYSYFLYFTMTKILLKIPIVSKYL